jgi:uncharacterized protein YjbI with pentapeptide repeats
LIAPVNTLVLRGEDLIDDAKLAHIIEKNESSPDAQRWVATFSLSGRDLTGADLVFADLRHVNFSRTILDRANLRGAWAKEADFERAQLLGASLDFAQLQGAWLDYAQLQGASLASAQLQGASLQKAQLQGASLNWAQLQGASFYLAQLRGASFYLAQLQGASLNQAQLQGASFFQASLQGASFDNAQLQGASLTNVCAWRAHAIVQFGKTPASSLLRPARQKNLWIKSITATGRLPLSRNLKSRSLSTFPQTNSRASYQRQ